MTVSQDLAAWAVESFRAVSNEATAVDHVRVHLRDTVAVAYAGSGEPSTRAMSSALTAATAPEGRALVLGTASHALDYDNAQAPSLVHPSCVTVPTAFLAAPHSVTGEQLIRAIAIGEEVSLWLGEMAVVDGTSLVFDRGLHPTGVCTPVGAAITAGLLKGLPADALAHAIGAAASLSGGILEGNRTGGDVKPMHAGFAVRAGLLASALADAGMTAPPTAIEGRFGLVHALIGADVEARVSDLPGPRDERWRLQTVITKPYPVNGFAHSMIDAVLELRRQGFRLEEGARLDIGLSGPTLHTLAEPRSDKLNPPSAYAARFSAPIIAAIALDGGSGLGVGLGDFTDDLLGRSEVMDAAHRVHLHADPDFTEAFPQSIGAVARGRSSSGETLEASVPHALGSPHRPLTSAQLRAKFDDCVRPVLGEEQSVSAWDEIEAICEGGSCGAEVASFLKHFFDAAEA